MPTRRGARGGKRYKNFKGKRTFKNNSAAKSAPEDSDESGQKTENLKPVFGPRFQVFSTIDMKKNDAGENVNENNEGESYPFKVKVSHLPTEYNIREFIDYFQNMFNIPLTKIITPEKNNPWLVIPLKTKDEQDKIVKFLHNHVWKKKVLQAVPFEESSLKRKAEDGEDDPESKKLRVEEETPALTINEDILTENLPLHNLPYEEQNRLTVQDVEILSNKLHAHLCKGNRDLAGWAEAMCEQNGGFIFKIEPLKPSPFLMGYRNKCKFRIAKNEEGEITVGFCSIENENQILGVEPGDKFIHLPDSLKLVAKKFQDFLRTTGKDPYDKKKKNGFWSDTSVRISPEGDVMLVVVMYPNRQKEEIDKVKEDLKNYFTSGEGKECNLYSLYFQIMSRQPPMLPPDKLELLMGEPSFEENICGLKFHVGPFTNINVNSPAAENIYKSVVELAEPKSDTIVLDLCSGSGGIALTIADKCEKVIAIEPQEENVKDALKTMKINEITNVEFIKGRVENELSIVFERFKDKDIIPVVDPPAQGLVTKSIGLIRANENIKKLVYVSSNTKLMMKNFVELARPAGKKEGDVVFQGLPFVPVKIVPVDAAPYTPNTAIVTLFERIDPSTFPAAKNPPPAVIKKLPVKKDQFKKTRRKFSGGKRFDGRNEQQGNRNRSGNSQTRFNGPPNRKGNRPPQMMNQRGQNFNQGGNNRFPPPLMGGPMDPAMNNLVATYEKRVAELEQENRAFKAGLSMGIQHALQGGNFNPNFPQQNQAPFGNFPNKSFNQGFNNPAWQNNQGSQGNIGPNQPPGNFNNPGMGNMGNLGNANMGNGFGGGNFGNPGGNFGNPGSSFGNPGNFGGRNNQRKNSGNFNKGFGGGSKNKGGGNFRNKQGNKPRR